MTAPDVTVVVIAFNDARRLTRAVTSVQRQTLRNLEIIVIDDASTDDTESLVGILAVSDPRIRYERLAQNSGGCSAPRNRGLDLARAPWVMFCDSDDEYERHACKNLLEAAERLDADIVCGTAERVDVASGRTKRWRPEVHEVEVVADGLTAFPELLYDTISVNKIYRRVLLVDSEIRFPEGLLFEDQLFTLEAFAAARRVAAIPEVVYRWYVDRLSDEPSITQRRNEARNVDSRIEINRRIDTFLTTRGLFDIQAIKDVKFLRHDLYLYLSSMLEVDDETAQTLMDHLSPYVSSVNLEPAWHVRPALRVAIYHLLVDDLAGLRAAMRFVKWASVVEVPIVKSDEREFWDCDHLAAGPPIAGRDVRDWLDMTDVHVTDIPFTERRYLHRLAAMSSAGRVVTASGTTVDYDGSLADVDRIELRLLISGVRTAASVPAAWTSKDGRLWQWRAEGQLSSHLGRKLTAKDRGTVGLALIRGEHENVTSTRAAEADLPRARIPYVGRTELLGPESIDLGAYDNGAVGWRAVRDTAQRNRLARARATWFRIPGTRRLAALVALIRRDVALTAMQRIGGLLRPRQLAVFESDGGRSVVGSVLAISKRLHEDQPSLVQAWVHRGRPELTPRYAEPVDRLSARHLWLLARARLWIDDGTSSLAVRKPGHTTAVLVSDGVPIHRFGLDDPSVLVSKSSSRDVTRRSARTDAILTASRFDTEVSRTALHFSGAEIETGVPRADAALLVRRAGSDFLAQARRDVDVPADRRIVLYLPIERSTSDGSLIDLDLDRWSAELGRSVYLLMGPQAPGSVSTRLRFAARTIDASEDIASYLAVADLVVSDYSPLIGDAALLDLPIVLFQSDRDIVANRTHGLYSHVGSPGPVTTTMDGLLGEVHAWLGDPGDWDERHRERRRAFVSEQCGPVDAMSSARAAAAIAELIRGGRR